MMISFRKSSLILLCLTSNLVFAENEIPCPTVKEVKAVSSKIDQAFGGRYDGGFSTWTSSPFYGKGNYLPWFVEVGLPPKDSGQWDVEEAILAGRNIVSGIALSKHQYATIEVDDYGFMTMSCDYGPGNVVTKAKMKFSLMNRQ